MRISIAMATYNGALYVGAQLESIAEQTLPPYELVVCDDCSGDDTVDIVKRFAKEAEFPVLLLENETRLGPSDNFLKAASFCSGDWIAFCDQDDYWLPRKLETVIKEIKAVHAERSGPRVVLAVHSAKLSDENLQLTGRRFPVWLTSSRTAGRFSAPLWDVLHGFQMVFESSLLHDVPWKNRVSHWAGNGQKMTHDGWIALLANAVGGCRYISEPLAIYRRHSSALTGRKDHNVFQQRLKGAFRHGAEDYSTAAQLFDEWRSHFYEIAACSGSLEIKEAMEGAADYYGAASQWMRARADLYGAKQVGARCRSLAQLWSIGAYWPADGRGLGGRAFAKDIAIGLTGVGCALRARLSHE